MESGATVAGQLSHALRGTCVHSLDSGRDLDFCLFQEPGFAALLCWVWFRLRTRWPKSKVALGPGGISGIAACGSIAVARRSDVRGTLAEFGRGKRSCHLVYRRRAELGAVRTRSAAGWCPVSIDGSGFRASGANCQPADGPCSERSAGLLLELAGEFRGSACIFRCQLADAAAGDLDGHGVVGFRLSASFSSRHGSGGKPGGSTGSVAKGRSRARYEGLVDTVSTNSVYEGIYTGRRELRWDPAGESYFLSANY